MEIFKNNNFPQENNVFLHNMQTSVQNKKPWNWTNVLKDVCSIQKTLFFLRKIKHFQSRNNVGDFEGGVFWRRPKQPTSFFTPLNPPKCKNLCFSLGKVILFEESQIFNSTRNVIKLMSAKATPPNLANFLRKTIFFAQHTNFCAKQKTLKLYKRP